MLHLLYILAFTTLAFLAVGNLLRSLMTLGKESNRYYGNNSNVYQQRSQTNLHPEMLDRSGNVVNEPLLVMRSVSVQDARQQLDAIYESSPSSGDDFHD